MILMLCCPLVLKAIFTPVLPPKCVKVYLYYKCFTLHLYIWITAALPKKRGHEEKVKLHSKVMKDAAEMQHENIQSLMMTYYVWYKWEQLEQNVAHLSKALQDLVNRCNHVACSITINNTKSFSFLQYVRKRVSGWPTVHFPATQREVSFCPHGVPSITLSDCRT